ncbi:acyl-CoA thioesterase [Roseiarcus fermentans]|uniref:Acyl-CoA thioesterase n=2 Tax=Roseiarcus fermentans TaxID=1473586 RepID=A0A366FD49_9HYPH|nr:acyl-CoA thioesterase [Roseiarcus fermentans]
MSAEDNTVQRHAIRIEAVGPGEASLSMLLTAAMTNGHGTGHGGFIFLLADTAFAYACNSHNQRCVAQHCSITYLRPAREGSRLTATAREVRRVDRSGVYDVSVADEQGTPIAEFRGISRTAPGTFF